METICLKYSQGGNLYLGAVGAYDRTGSILTYQLSLDGIVYSKNTLNLTINDISLIVASKKSSDLRNSYSGKCYSSLFFLSFGIPL